MVSERMKPSKSCIFVLNIVFVCAVSYLILLISFSSAIVEYLILLKPSTTTKLRNYRANANTVGKDHFTTLYSAAREKAFASYITRAGWGRSGLYPLNTDRVLRDIRKPPAEITISKANDVTVGTCSHEAVLQTPVTADALFLPRGLVERDTYTLDDEGKLRMEKLLNAL